MKNIAVVIPSFVIEYSFDFLSGIAEFSKDKDVRFILTQTKLPHSTTCIFDYQNWTGMEILTSDEIDAIIVATGVYYATPHMDEKSFIAGIEKLTKKPVISVAMPLPVDETYSVLTDCQDAYYKMVKHLKEEHNCSKFAFLSALSTKSSEAVDRFEAYKLALANNGLNFDENLVWDGCFTETETENILSQVLKSKEDVTFDAVVSSNDNMAVGCINILKKLGIKVPEDVKVVGFDDSLLAVISDPKLSTIDQQVFRQSYDAAKYAYDLLEGKELPRVKYTKLSPKYRQSCGCIARDIHYPIYMNSEKEIIREDDRNSASLSEIRNHFNEQNNIVTIMDMLKGANTLRQFYYNFPYIVGQIDMDFMSINLYDDTVYLDSHEDFHLPNNAEMYMFTNRIDETGEFRPGITFDPHKKLFATDSYCVIPGLYVLQPIYSGESNYGFALGHIKSKKFAEYNVYLKIVITSLSQSYEYTRKIMETERLTFENSRLQENNTSLSKESKTDELTGILNRRGFFEVGQRSLDIMQEMDSAGIVFFFDMDGLKKINDTYGHEMGDKAIQLLAKSIKSVFRSSDVVGRLSGDEFGVVALGMIEENIPKIRRKIVLMNERVSRQNDLPFTLSVSFGTANLHTSTVLKKLLTVADGELYKEKRKKHGQK